MGQARATAWEFRRRDIKDRPLTTSRAQENPWPSTLPSTGENPSTLLMLHPYQSDSSSMPPVRFGILPQAGDYSRYDPKPLTSKEPWSMPSPVSYGRRDLGTPTPACKFPHGYAPQLLPDSPPLRWHGTYKGKGRSRLIAAAEGDDEMEGGGPAPPDRPGPTDEERLEQAHDLYRHEQQRADRLEQEIEALRQGQRPGRDPLRRRGPPAHRFSIP